MTLTHINSDKLVKPYGYSHAVIADAKKQVFIAGQVASDIDGKIDANLGHTGQASIALQNFTHALDATGASMSHIAQMTIYVVGLNTESGAQVFKGIAQVSKAVGMRPSASVVVGVHSLMDPAALVEISGVAILES